MHSYFWFYVLGTIGIALLVFMIPMCRQQLAKCKLPLEQRYAKEIANGEAVIVPKDPAALKILILIIAASGVLFALFQRLQTYISSLEKTCTELEGWNSLFVYLGGSFIVGSIVILIAIMWMYKDYQEIIHDGYVPSRKSKQHQDRIAFKLTKQLKLKEQLRLAILVIASIFLMSTPFLILHILLNISPNKSISIYELNAFLQEACLDDLKKER